MNYKVNEQIKPFEIVVDKYCPFYYAGASGDFNPIHIDNDFAKKAGLGGIILQGLCTMAFAYRAVMGDKDPEKIKKLKVRFRNVVKPLDRLTVKGRISDIQDKQILIDFIAENQKKEQVITNAQAVIEGLLC